MIEAIGLLELASIARGIVCTDAMVKAAPVRIVASQTVCAGKYLVLVTGSVADVKAAMEAGREAGEGGLIDELTIPNPHQGIFPALAGTVQVDKPDALGVIETFSAAATIVAADLAAKAADVTLTEVRLANGLGGKAYVVLTGDVASVNEAVREAESGLEGQALIVETCVIPGPHPDLRECLR